MFKNDTSFINWDILISPRWHKVINDFWYNRSRLGLAIISIAVGVFGLGTVLAERVILLQNIDTQFNAANGATASLQVPNFDDGLVKHVRKFSQVSEADAVRSVEMRVLVPPSTLTGKTTEEWRTLQLIAIDKFDDIRLNHVEVERGIWPPPQNGLVVERSSLKLMGVNLGDTLLVETNNGLQRKIPIVGVVKDVTIFPSDITNNAAGYISFDTLPWIEEPRAFNKLLISLQGKPTDRTNVNEIMNGIRDRIEWDGWMVNTVNVPQYPNRPPVENNFQTIILILTIIGLLLVIISIVMVANTMDAVLTQQIRQIGIMRIIGGQLNQVFSLYLIFALLLGVIALLIGIPLSIIVSLELCKFVAAMMNYDILSSAVIPWVIAVQIVVALLVALLASLKPILSSTLFTTVREAIGFQGLDAGFKMGIIEHILGKLRGLSGPVMLSLRNTFRKRWRLGMTLFTLSLGGGVFVAVFCLNASLYNTAYNLLGQFSRYDLLISLNRPYRLQEVSPIITQTSGVKAIEGWRTTTAPRYRSNDTESDPINITAAPSTTKLLAPVMLAGRWLQPDDMNAIVVNQYVFDREPDLHVGSDMVLIFGQYKTTWHIVGEIRGIVGVGQTPMIYVNYEPFTQATNSIGIVNSLEITTTQRDSGFLSNLGNTIVAHLTQAGYHVKEVQTATDNLKLLEVRIQILTSVLVTVSMILALVGGISLMGTMGINVIERTREIGVMRAIGASSGDLMQITVTEGVIIGWISWLIAGIIANPLGQAMSYRIGMAFFNAALMFSYSFSGLGIWLGVVTVISIIASIVPSQNAMRITVREAISYE